MDVVKGVSNHSGLHRAVWHPPKRGLCTHMTNHLAHGRHGALNFRPRHVQSVFTSSIQPLTQVTNISHCHRPATDTHLHRTRTPDAHTAPLSSLAHTSLSRSLALSISLARSAEQRPLALDGVRPPCSHLHFLPGEARLSNKELRGSAEGAPSAWQCLPHATAGQGLAARTLPLVARMSCRLWIFDSLLFFFLTPCSGPLARSGFFERAGPPGTFARSGFFDVARSSSIGATTDAGPVSTLASSFACIFFLFSALLSSCSFSAARSASWNVLRFVTFEFFPMPRGEKSGTAQEGRRR